MRFTPSLFACVLFAVAFGLRLGTVFAFRDIHQGPVGDICLDDVQFNALAANLSQGYGYRVTPDGPLTSFRAPGFPFMLAGLYWVVGVDPAPAYVFFCVLGALTCVLTYFLAREVLTETGARVAGGLCAIYLPHIFMATIFNSESAFVPVLALGLWMFILHVKHRSHLALGLAGLALGYATLTRPVALLLLPLLVGVLAWCDLRERTLRPLGYFVFSILFLGIIAPWTWRNYEVHGKFVAVSTNGGTTFWGGNNDRVLWERKHLGYWLPNPDLPHRDKIDAARTELERDQIEWRLGKEWIRENLVWMPLLECYKFARLWWLPDYGPGLRWLRISSYVPFLLLFAGYALFLSWRRESWSPEWLVLHASIWATIAITLIFFGEPRFRDACTPVLMIYATAVLSRSFRHPSAPLSAPTLPAAAP